MFVLQQTALPQNKFTDMAKVFRVVFARQLQCNKGLKLVLPEMAAYQLFQATSSTAQTPGNGCKVFWATGCCACCSTCGYELCLPDEQMLRHVRGIGCPPGRWPVAESADGG